MRQRIPLQQPTRNTANAPLLPCTAEVCDVQHSNNRSLPHRTHPFSRVHAHGLAQEVPLVRQRGRREAQLAPVAECEHDVRDEVALVDEGLPRQLPRAAVRPEARQPAQDADMVSGGLEC